MSDVIVETNVAVVANRQNADVVSECVEACILFLVDVVENHTVLLDQGDEIRAEYSNAIAQARPYQLGAQFLVHVLRHLGDGEHVRQVDLPKKATGFADFPNDLQLAAFDPSDRKFAALAHRTNEAVTNATDSDWADFRAPLQANGIQVNFLCGCNPTAWFLDLP